MNSLATTLPQQLGRLASSPPLELALAAGVGLIGGVFSGLCGVSPGGTLVVLSTLVLGAEQHLAQGISLAAQVPPTSISGVARYRKEGAGCPLGWLSWIGSGFLLGGTGGAIGAARVSSSALQWSYVAYLGILDAMLILRSSAQPGASNTTDFGAELRTRAPALFAVGLLAGLSSGYLGIGGGLAIVAGLAAGLKVPQHQAQLISLVLSIIPTTIPAAYIYWRAGFLPSWPALIAVIVGLWAGTDLGARAAHRVSETTLRRVLIIMVSTMTAYMAWKA